jgi:hypothetical protein
VLGSQLAQGNGAVTTAKEYLHIADQCVKWAEETKDDAQRQELLDMANAWVQAAAKLDANLRTAQLAPATPLKQTP